MRQVEARMRWMNNAGKHGNGLSNYRRCTGWGFGLSFDDLSKKRMDAEAFAQPIPEAVKRGGRELEPKVVCPLSPKRSEGFLYREGRKIVPNSARWNHPGFPQPQ